MKCLHSLNSVCPAENNNDYNWIATEAEGLEDLHVTVTKVY